MGKLSELVDREYQEELTTIKETGNLWTIGIGIAVALVIFCLIDFLRGQPWKGHDFVFGIVFACGVPFFERAWERHKVAAAMRHQREVRMEMKLDALLGLVNIKEN